MKTKALILTVALGAAGVATSMAQVFSQNAVGYVNVVIYRAQDPALTSVGAANSGFNLVCNPLVQASTTLFALIPTAPENTRFFGFDPVGGFIANQIIGGEWDSLDPNTIDIAAGKGFFLQNLSGADFTITFVGEVAQGALSTPVSAPYALLGSKVPQAGDLNLLEFDAVENDLAYVYDNHAGAENGYFSAPQFVGGEWDPVVPSVGVGQGFWIINTSIGSHIPWTRTFNVQ